MDEEKSRQEQLREIDELKAQLLELLDHLPDAFVETEIAEQRVVYLNRMAQLPFGYDADDVRAGLPGRALFAEDQFDEVQSALARYVGPTIQEGVRYVKSGRQELLEFRMRRKDSSNFAAETPDQVRSYRLQGSCGVP